MDNLGNNKVICIINNSNQIFNYIDARIGVHNASVNLIECADDKNEKKYDKAFLKNRIVNDIEEFYDTFDRGRRFFNAHMDYSKYVVMFEDKYVCYNGKKIYFTNMPAFFIQVDLCTESPFSEISLNMLEEYNQVQNLNANMTNLLEPGDVEAVNISKTYRKAVEVMNTFLKAKNYKIDNFSLVAASETFFETNIIDACNLLYNVNFNNVEEYKKFWCSREKYDKLNIEIQRY